MRKLLALSAVGLLALTGCLEEGDSIDHKYMELELNGKPIMCIVEDDASTPNDCNWELYNQSQPGSNFSEEPGY